MTDDLVLPAQRRHDRRDVDAVGRPEQLLVPVRQAGARDRRRRLGQEREDAAAVVVDQHDRRRQGVELGRDQRVEVVQEGHVADDQRDRPARHRRRSERRGDHAVDAVGTTVRAHRDRALGHGQPAVQVADGHRVAGPERRPVRQRGGERRERGPLEWLVEPGQPGGHGLGRRAVGRSPSPRPTRRHRSGRRAARRSASAVAAGSACTNVRRHERRLAPARIAVEDDAGPAASARAARRSAWTWASRRCE